MGGDNAMRYLCGIILGLCLTAAYAQTLTPSGGGGGSGTTSLAIGSTPITGSASGQVLFAGNGILRASNVSSSALGLTFPPGAASNCGGVGIWDQANVGSTGMTFDTNQNIGFCVNSSAYQWYMQNASSFTMSNNIALAWSSTTDASTNGTKDTGISRHATAGIIDIGNGTAGNISGGLQTGNATLISLTTGTNADFLCLNAGGGILIQTTACTISSLRFKPDWKPYKDDALAKVAKLDVGIFHTETGPNADPNAKSLQAGLNAEDIAKIAPECAIYENDMKTPKSYRQECVIALLVKAIQQLKHDK